MYEYLASHLLSLMERETSLILDLDGVLAMEVPRAEHVLGIPFPSHRSAGELAACISSDREDRLEE